MEQMNQAYKVFTRICLNNWHYIDRKVLGLNESINFFTGHSCIVASILRHILP